MPSPSIVIKVKYGETLRRFSTLVKGDQQLQLNMEELRAKICSLFHFPPDANFTLTYIDEDGDQVTLADNEDLHDVVIQGLNPVRVTIHLDSTDGAFSGTQSSGNLTLNRSSAQTYQNIELALKAVSANPVLTDIVDNVSKIIRALRNPPHSRSATATSTHEVHADGGMTCNGFRSKEPSFKSIMSKGTEPVTSPVPPYFFFQKAKDLKTQCSTGISGIDNNGKHKKDKVTVSKCSPNSLDPLKARSERHEDRSSSSHTRVRRVYKHDGRHFDLEHFDGNFYYADGMESIFHKDIRCDGCGVLPITGPRFMSKVKYDYDLCNICFTRMGNYSDYTRIDFPSLKRRMFKGFHEAACPRFKPIQPLVPAHFNNQLRPRLDSRFIEDVNVMDGTIMAPSTPFTKIWRMQNIGTRPWSHGLQLLWVGGGRFGSRNSFKIEIPTNGVDVGEEVDVAVDFNAPELPGKYISIWRLAESSGHMFGQRLSVVIQVDPLSKEDDSTCESSASLYFNQPLDNTPDPNPEEDRNQKIDEVDLNLPINNDNLIGDSEVSCASSTSSASSSVLQCAFPFDSNPNDSSLNLEDKGGNESEKKKNDNEESSLKEFEMGFDRIDLNKEVVRGNEYELEKSVDEICGVSEWDPILEELKEMGFHDKVMNKKMLKKNNGSIVRVVMDLVSGQEG